MAKLSNEDKATAQLWVHSLLRGNPSNVSGKNPGGFRNPSKTDIVQNKRVTEILRRNSKSKAAADRKFTYYGSNFGKGKGGHESQSAFMKRARQLDSRNGSFLKRLAKHLAKKK